MKISIFNGSPRGKNSNTHVITTAFKDGAESSGAEVKNYFLIEKEINHCTGCFSCWRNTPGQCIHNDDMSELLNAYKSSDIVCFATPVYSWDVTACLKNFIDRLIPLKCKTVIEDDGKYDMQNSLNKTPDIVAISNAGFPGDNNFQTIKIVMAAASPVLEIYRNCGMLLQSLNKEIMDKVEEYLVFVKNAGAAIAGKEDIPNEVLKGLQMELLPTDKYIKYISG